MTLFGRVVAQFATFVGDGPDSDDKPDFVPLTGTVTFTPSVKRIIDSSTPPGIIIGSSPFVAVLDEMGFLSTPIIDVNGKMSAGAQGIWLVATNDPNLNPTAFQYMVSYSLKTREGRAIEMVTHPLAVPSDSELNLALVIPPANAPAIGTAAAEAAAALAVAALSKAVRLVNGVAPDANGNVVVSGSGSGGGLTQQDLDTHIEDTEPHPAYDEMPDLDLYYANRKAVQ